MTRYLLDTDVLIDFLRGHPAAIGWIENCVARPLVSVITVAELRAGLRAGEEDALEVLIHAFEAVEITTATASRAGDFRRQYGPSHGTGLADALIAASAVEVQARLITLNVRHFPMLEAEAPYAR